MSQFTLSEQAQIEAKGKTVDQVRAQIDIFRKGVAPANLDRACVIGDGIQRGDAEQRFLDRFEEARAKGRVTKFVPASGAASRMFKSLHTARATLAEGGDLTDEAVLTFFSNLSQFAFAPALASQLDVAELDLPACDRKAVLDAFLGEDGLNYANQPKGLLHFHREGGQIRTPVAEHLAEAVAYARDAEGNARLHFTVSPEHAEGFRQEVNEASAQFEDTHFLVDFSVQSPATDTIAVTPQNEPFREGDALLFRPGGHGALIENLNNLDADLVFIKNIDNVVPDRLKAETIRSKQMLGGYLLTLQDRIFHYLRQLQGGERNLETLKEMGAFIHEHLGYRTQAPLVGDDADAAADTLYSVLNRPLRVCGMVRNEGEPGGGPFWVLDDRGVSSTQIVESSQIDSGNPDQAAIASGATHFNPVDLVCALCDVNGQAFDLSAFVDHDACFISEKSKNGRDLRALELPGLWNGAMAHWNTAFVEVPLITFNPVKTVNDLLREQHR